MKWINKLKLVFRELSGRVFISLLLFGMSIASFYMIDTVMTDYLSDTYAIRRTRNMFNTEPAKVNYIKFIDLLNSTTEQSDFIREYISELPGITGCGYISSHWSNDLIDGLEVGMVTSEMSLIDMGNLKLTEEQKKELINYNGEYKPVYLGHSYKDKVNIGDIFTLSLEEEDNCIVMGFLEKGAAWPKRGTLFGESSDLDSFTLDENGIAFTHDFSVFENFGGYASEVYYITEQPNDETVRQQIIDYAVENKISIGIVNCGEVIEEEIADNSITADKTFVAAILLVLLAVTSMTAASVIYCLMNKKNYGTMQVCGMKRRDILWLLAAQNTIIMVVSAVVAWVIRQRELFGGLVPPKEMASAELVYLKDIVTHNIYIPVLMLVLLVLMLVATSILPAMVIRKMSLIEMLHDKR